MKNELFLIIADSALETIPKEIIRHPAVLKNARRRNKKPELVLLERSYHHSAMHKIPNPKQRGRPDIIHFSLLTALTSPLSLEGKLSVVIHTINNQIITINPRVRLPPNFERFRGLFEKLFEEKEIQSDNEILLSLRAGTILDVIQKSNIENVIALSRTGVNTSLREIVEEARSLGNTAWIVGGYPSGDFSLATKKLIKNSISIYPAPLATWTVISRLIVEWEHQEGLLNSVIKTP